jgi:(p)ppGpp synthase/HD superfamily hydrolase
VKAGEVLKARALEYAIFAHGDQVRKYTGEPYWTHPKAVGDILKQYIDNPEAIAACYLHDVLEDTHISESVLRAEFGDIVTDLVMEVTDVSKPEDGNRAERKKLDREHLYKASYMGKSIKLADLIHNSESILSCDPNFARVYMREKKELLGVLVDGHNKLWLEAFTIVYNYRNSHE